MHPFGQRFGEPEDVAGIAVFLASSDARWVHGAAIVVGKLSFTCRISRKKLAENFLSKVARLINIPHFKHPKTGLLLT